MSKETYTIDWYGSIRKFERISRQYARKLYNSGSHIFLLPCNANLNNSWIQSMLYRMHKISTNNVPFENAEYQLHLVNSISKSQYDIDCANGYMLVKVLPHGAKKEVSFRVSAVELYRTLDAIWNLLYEEKKE